MTPRSRIMSQDHALNAFLLQYLDDLAAGKPRALAEYQARFPGHEGLIAAQFGHYPTPSKYPTSSIRK